MKLTSNKSALALAMVLTFGLAHQALAHDKNGALKSTSGASATDYYIVSCSGASDHLFFQIKDNTADANLIGVTVFSATAPYNAKASSTVDAVGGDAVYSPALKLKGGNGDYVVAVWRTAGTTLQSYLLQYHCEDINNAHTTTATAQTISDQ